MKRLKQQAWRVFQRSKPCSIKAGDAEDKRNLLYIIAFLLSCFFIIALNYRLSAWLLPGYTLYDIKRILEVALLCSSAVGIAFIAELRLKVLGLFYHFPGYVRILIFCIFLLGACSALLATNQAMAMTEVMICLLLFIFSLGIGAVRIIHVERFDKTLLWILMLGLVLYELTFLKVYFTCVFYSKPWNVFPGFINIRFLDQYLVFVLPLATLPIILCDKQTKAIKFFLYALASLAWMIAISNVARGLYFSLAVSCLCCVLFFGKKLQPWIHTQIKSIVSGALVFGFLRFVIPQIYKLFNILASTSTNHMIGTLNSTMFERILLWKYACRLIKQHVFFGVGPLHFAIRGAKSLGYEHHFATHPHNSLFLIASEWGIPVVICVIIISVLAGRSWVKNREKLSADSSLKAALTISVFAGIIYSFISGVIVMPLSQVMLFLIIGWMLGIYYVQRKDSLIVSGVFRQAAFMLAVLTLSFGLTVNIAHQAVRLPQQELRWMFHEGNAFPKAPPVFKPRLWNQGIISPKK